MEVAAIVYLIVAGIYMSSGYSDTATPYWAYIVAGIFWPVLMIFGLIVMLIDPYRKD